MRFTLGGALGGISAALALVCSPPAFGAECDNFTGRDSVVREATPALDAFTNLRMARALKKLALEKAGCDRMKLFNGIKSQLGWSPVGQLEYYASTSTVIEHLPQHPFASIYHEPGFLGLPLNRLGGAVPSVKVNGHIIGVDKLGHFMAQGLDYYLLVHEGGKTVEQAMQWGIYTEETYFGLWPSGVKSYGDVSANLAGYFFWENVLDGLDPYFACVGDEYVQRRGFSWADYVSDAWDEAINCSEFSEKLGGAVERNLKKLGMTCPVAGSEQICARLAALPGSALWLSPKCRAAAR